MKLSKRIALIFASLLMVLCVSVSVSAKESPTKQSFNPPSAARNNHIPLRGAQQATI